MAKTILNTEKGTCYLCGVHTATEEHHIFGGGLRKKSEQYGLKVYLCHTCHNEPPHGVHFNRASREKLHKIGQQAFHAAYPNLDFMEVFGRNYE